MQAYLLINLQRSRLDLLRQVLAHDLDGAITRDILIVLALLGLGRGRPDWLSKTLALGQTGGHGHAVDGTGLFVLGPA